MMKKRKNTLQEVGMCFGHNIYSLYSETSDGNNLASGKKSILRLVHAFFGNSKEGYHKIEGRIETLCENNENCYVCVR